MNLTGNEQNSKDIADKKSTEQSTQTSDIINRLETLRASLNSSTIDIELGIDRLVGEVSDRPTVDAGSKYSTGQTEYFGELGRIQSLIDSIFEIANINGSNRARINKIA